MKSYQLMNVTVKVANKNQNSITLMLNVEQRPYQSILVQLLDWDTQMLGMRCARIAEFATVAAIPKLPMGIYRALVQELLNLQLEYVTVRTPQAEWSRIQALEAAGFRMVDGILEFGQKTGEIAEFEPPPTYEFRLAKSSEAESIAILAGNSFQKSRFHNDPLLDEAQAKQVHMEWARNCCLGKAADAVWLCAKGPRVVGFVTCKCNGTFGTIGLIAVGEGEAGQGLGKALVQRARRWFVEQKCTQISVQTQSDNFAAIRLYMSTGFSPISTSTTLRWAAKEETK